MLVDEARHHIERWNGDFLAMIDVGPDHIIRSLPIDKAQALSLLALVDYGMVSVRRNGGVIEVGPWEAR